MPEVSRRDLLKTGLLSITALPALSRAADAPQKRPNILFILSDDQRADTIAALGNPHIKTPNLDKLVARGTAFTNAYIMGGTQGAVCAPSRAMILTGRTLFHTPDQPGPNLSLWPQVLRQQGYTTFGCGKWHNGPATYARCFSAGGPVFFGGMSNQYKLSVADFDPSGKYAPKNRRVAETFSSELFADSAVRFLRQYKDDKPFALWLSFTTPHDPRTPSPKFAAMYDPDKLPLPGNYLPRHPFDNGELVIRDEKLLPVPREKKDIQHEIAAYYAMISQMDEQIGRVLDALEQSGQLDNTIIVFAGDNGLALGSHGLLGKQNVYEHSVRVPLIIAGPGIPQGQKSDALCYLLDIFPTLFDRIGLTPPPSVEGQSLLPALAGPKAARPSLFFAYRHFQRAVRDQRYKLIRYYVAGRQTTQLFDLQSDPLELKDLSADPSHAQTRARMEGLLKQWQAQAGDKLNA